MSYNKESYKCWYEKNKERKIAQMDLYREKNIDAVRQAQRKRNVSPKGKANEVKRKDWIYSRLGNIKIHYGCTNPACPIKEHKLIDFDFHHLDPSQKEMCIAGFMRFKSKLEIYKEVNKCVVLCCICHRRLHAGLWTIETPVICNVDEELLVRV